MKCPTCGHQHRTPRAAKLITASAAAAYRLCPRKFRLAYVDGLRPVHAAAALAFGTIWHAAMEAWWQRLEWAPPEMDAYDAAKLSAMLAAYDLRWSAVRDEYRVIGIEMPFRAPLLDGRGAPVRGWAIAGKIDGLLELAGYPLLLEHKTTSESVATGADYWAQLTLDAQVSIYHDGAAALGHQVAGCLYDVARKPALRPSMVPVLDDAGLKVVLDASGQRAMTKHGEPRQSSGPGLTLHQRPETPSEYQARCLAAIAERPEEYLAQAQVVRLDGELAAARDDLAGTARQIDACAKAGSWPRNPRACFEYGRCPYHGLCSGTATESEFTKLTDVHPELQAPQEPLAA